MNCRNVMTLRRSRWLTLVASTWLMASAGLSYTFPLFSKAIKEALNYDDVQLEALAFAADFGNNAGIFAGFLALIFPDWLLLLIGSLLTCVGFLTLALVCEKTIVLPFPVILITNFLALNGTTFYSTVALVSSMRNFPRHRGLVVGLLSGFLGLSAALFTNIYSGFLPHSPYNFLLQLSVATPLVGLVAIPFYFCWDNDQKTSQETQKLTDSSGSESDEAASLQLSRLFFILICMAIILFSYTLALLLTNIGTVVGQIVAVLLVVLLIVPIFAPPSLYCAPSIKNNVDVVESRQGAQRAPSVLPTSTVVQRRGMAACFSLETVEETSEILLSEVFWTFNFWLAGLSFLVSGGSVLAALNSLGQLMSTLATGSISSAISFISLWTFTGMVLATHFSETYLAEYSVPRPVILAVGQICLVPGHFLMALSTIPSIYLSSIFIGLGFGAILTLLPTIIVDLFGIQNFAVIFNFERTALPLGSLLLSVLFSGFPYDLSNNVWKPLCFGPKCFGSVFLVFGSLSLLAAALSAWLAIRMTKIYEKIAEKHPSRIVAIEYSE